MERRHLLGGAITALLVARADVVLAAPDDYCFEVVAVQRVLPGKTAVDVVILRVRDATPITGAVVVRGAAALRPPGKPQTIARVVLAASGRLGIHRFEIDTTAAGIWALDLTLTVPRASRTERSYIPGARHMYTRTLPGNAELVSGSVTFVVR